jgi:hypothetical protein
MKKQDVKQKKVFDLDAALEQVAQTLRPTANGACGTTNIFKTDPLATATNAAPCLCYCCSATSPGRPPFPY